MKFLEKITKKEARMQRYIGLNFHQLNVLTENIEPSWRIAESDRLNKRLGRKRKIGAGRLYELETTKEKLIVVLLYYKMYMTQEFLGDFVGIDQSNVSRLIAKMLPLIEEAADPELKSFLAEAKSVCRKRISSYEELVREFPDLQEISTDATEQSVYRSKNYETQKKYYSGKSKEHTIKTQISVSRSGRIVDVSASCPGSVHDKALTDQERTVERFDERIPQRLDSGYQGLAKDHPDHYLILPIKKTKNRSLNQEEKEHNRAHSKRRVKVEHAISRLKKYRALSGVFRQPLGVYNTVFRSIASILNFKRNNSVYAC